MPEATPDITVITPAFDPSEFDTYLQSMGVNAGVAAEWIVVDDGSDDSFDRVFDMLRGTKAKIVRLQRNKGQAAARNAGLLEAKGRWVKFLDADDALSEGHLERLLDVAEALLKERVLAFAPTRHIFVESGRTYVNRRYLTAGETAEEQLSHFLASPFLHHCGVLFPRDLAITLGPYDPKLKTDEDGDLLIRTLLAGYSFHAVDDAFYEYRHRSAARRVSYDGDLGKLMARRAVSRRVVQHYRDRNEELPASVRSAVATRLDLLATRAVRTHPQFARDVLHEARRLAPGYLLSGSRPERLLRTMIGLSASQRMLGLVRRVRGIKVV